MKNLDKRKRLAGKVFGVGINRIIFDNSRLDEIKEAITKQDIKDLHESGAIIVNPVLGRKTKEKRRTRRGFGKIKMKINPGKEKYVTLVRKLREYIGEIRKQEKIEDKKYWELRKKIKSSEFRDKSHLKEHISGGK